MTTIEEFLNDVLKPQEGQIAGMYLYDTPDEGPRSGVFFGNAGDFRLSPVIMRAATKLGKDFREFAEANGKTLQDFPELNDVKGYDIDPNNWSNEEIGTYLVGHSMAYTLGFSLGRVENPVGDIVNSLFPVLSKNAPIALEFGRQVYGDNLSYNSSIDTTTEESLGDLKAEYGKLTGDDIFTGGR